MPHRGGHVVPLSALQSLLLNARVLLLPLPSLVPVLPSAFARVLLASFFARVPPSVGVPVPPSVGVPVPPSAGVPVLLFLSSECFGKR